jgi:probable F420-dependent oxidoreductase
MQLGIHLPHAGEQATPALIRRHAMRAEALGFDDVWVSEHIIVPRREFPRSPLFYDPVVTLSYAAAVTERVRLGTTVLVLPMRHPLPLAKELASLHNLSNGRLILGAGVGWLEPEFAALGVPFRERGRRMDEGIAMMLVVWGEDPVSFPARHIPAVIADMRMLPQPVKPIPIWIGGSSEAALARAARLDGWHGSRLSPEEALPVVRRLREKRPERGFTISLRSSWDGKDDGALGARLAAYGEVGIDHVLVEPAERAIEDWLRAVERVAHAVESGDFRD